MSILGKLIKTGFDVVTSPIAMAKDVIPGAGGYIDGHRSLTAEKLEQVADDGKEIREELEDL